MTVDFGRFEALTFDCYGTLIDWESGILAALREPLDAAPNPPSDDRRLEAFGRAEAAVEAGPYRRYRDVLGEVLHRLGKEFGAPISDDQAAAFGDSVGDWPAFPDTAAALEGLHRRFRLGVITNCDDDLFARSAIRLETEFDWVVTAQQAGSYKPDERNFHLAFERLGLPRDRILHVAQSLYHDHVPAKRLGVTSVWIDRRQGRAGGGATPPAEARPDATYPDMASFAAAASR
jgi:2-haloacid dehalogenase